MKLEYVKPSYTIAQERLLYTKTLSGNRQLNIVARPLNLGEGVNPPDLDDAFKSVVWDEYVPMSRPYDSSYIAYRLGAKPIKSIGNWEEDSQVIAQEVENHVPGLLTDERTAYFCPVIAEYGDSCRAGYVVAWGEKEARTVAAYTAGAYININMELLDRNGKYINGRRLRVIEYTSIAHKPIEYWHIIEKDYFLEAMEALAGIKVPKSKNTQFLGAELLETFTKLKLA